ncbi:glycosyltransferase family 4 protein [Arcticibacter sp. MXS-1]|uniref:glycosyltransferase family 4 protein n=1 Tax=Arcticibacter sp. MXS-1 TaxID=3341726 RepID=UPI0035A922B0
MRILFITHRFHPDVGGIEVNSEILATAFHQAGHHVRLLTWTKESDGKDFAFPVIRNPGINELLREHRRADVVYENNPSLRLSWPAIVFAKPTVIAIRTWIARGDGRLNWQDKLKYLWLDRAKAVIAVSEAIRNRCCKEAVVIGNPYRDKIFRKIQGIDRSSWFVFVGRLVSDKGADLAIQALHSLVLAERDSEGAKFEYNLTIIGEGPERSTLEEMTRSLGLSARVNFKGTLRGDDLVHCLNEHRFILVPSIWEEPFGNVALEGMACGCIPIVSNGGGLPDAVGSGGLIFQRNTLSDLVAKISNTVQNPVLQKELLEKAELHLQRHVPKEVGRRYLEVVESAVKLSEDI